jgi:hypothetical protein
MPYLQLIIQNILNIKWLTGRSGQFGFMARDTAPSPIPTVMWKGTQLGIYGSVHISVKLRPGKYDKRVSC